MASLSYPQMAATLASAVVGYQTLNGSGQRLLDTGFVNAVVVVIVVTCILGPILTTRYARRMAKEEPLASGDTAAAPEATSA